MPDERLIDPREHASDKVSALSDLEYRVWMTYKIAADDFGVMRASVAVLQAAHRGLERVSAPKIKAALGRLISAQLLTAFKDGSETYVCSLVWQDHQRVRYPRATQNPAPPPEVLSQCSCSTAELFRKSSRTTSATFPQNPEPPVRGRARNANANANANALAVVEGVSGGGSEGEDRAVMAGRFWATWREVFPSAPLTATPKEFQALCELAETCADGERFRAVAHLLVTSPAMASKRGIGMLRAKWAELSAWLDEHPGVAFGAARMAQEATRHAPRAEPYIEPLECPHDPPCGGKWACQRKTQLDAARSGVAASPTPPGTTSGPGWLVRS